MPTEAPHRAEVEDTYAEAFRSLYAEVLITARDRTWLDLVVSAATGNASSTILCDCEAGLDRYVGPGGDESFATPDGRPGAVVQFHVPRFHKDRAVGKVHWGRERGEHRSYEEALLGDRIERSLIGPRLVANVGVILRHQRAA